MKKNKKKATPAKRKAAPVRRKAVPARKKPAPSKKKAAPVRKKAAPVRKKVAPARKKAPVPVRKVAAPPAKAIHRADYPAVCEFLEGYMHQDFAQVHGSADAAARAFVADANAEERAALLKEWRALLKATHGLPADRIGDLFTHQLGGMWSPVSREEVEALLAALSA